MRIIFSYLKDLQTIAAKKCTLCTLYYMYQYYLWPFKEILLDDCQQKIYNNCLISPTLIGSYLSSVRVQIDKILIYSSFQVQLSAVKLSTF